MTLDLSILQIPDASVVPEPTTDQIVFFQEELQRAITQPKLYKSASLCVSMSLARRCRELEAEVERLKNMLESIRFLCGFDTEADAWAAVRKGGSPMMFTPPLVLAETRKPNNSRNVLCFGPNKKPFVAFWWRAEELWYACKGGKNKKDAVEVVYWCELEGSELR